MLVNAVTVIFAFFRPFAKLQKTTNSFDMSVCLSVRPSIRLSIRLSVHMGQVSYQWTEFYEM